MRTDTRAWRPCARLTADRQRRYPDLEPPAPAATEQGSENPELDSRLRNLPPEVGTLLIIVGIAGILLPGPVGTPFLIAGGIGLWPDALGRVDDWFRRRFPAMHREGMTQVDRFLSDLEQRYPGSLA